MTGPQLGEKVKVRYTDQFDYTLEVEVIAICEFDKFIGRVERVFACASEFDVGGEILESNTRRDLEGRERQFKKADVITCQTTQLAKSSPGLSLRSLSINGDSDG
jgi:hypothetical protein